MACRAKLPILAWGLAWALALPLQAGAQTAPDRAAPPTRIGPEWDGRNHQPNPAEVEARGRALGVTTTPDRTQAQEVDKLYRDLTGRDPAAPARSTTPRDTDRR